jgi:cell shape-determining protein MreD
MMHITAVLPSTTIALLLHLGFSGRRARLTLTFGLAVALVLGYLEDLHQGGPPGVLCLAHGLTYLLVHFAARRFAVDGWRARVGAGIVLCFLTDLCTWALLSSLAGGFKLSTAGLRSGLALMPWRALETGLLVNPVWLLADTIFSRLGPGRRGLAGQRSSGRSAWGGERRGESHVE